MPWANGLPRWNHNSWGPDHAFLRDMHAFLAGAWVFHRETGQVHFECGDHDRLELSVQRHPCTAKKTEDLVEDAVIVLGFVVRTPGEHALELHFGRPTVSSHLPAVTCRCDQYVMTMLDRAPLYVSRVDGMYTPCYLQNVGATGRIDVDVITADFQGSHMEEYQDHVQRPYFTRYFAGWQYGSGGGMVCIFNNCLHGKSSTELQEITNRHIRGQDRAVGAFPNKHAELPEAGDLQKIVMAEVELCAKRQTLELMRRKGFVFNLTYPAYNEVMKRVLAFIRK